MKEQKNKKDRKKPGLGGILLMVLMLLSQFTGEDGFIALIIFLALGVLGVSVYVIVKAAKKTGAVKTEEPCAFGKVNHEFSHDANRRLSQLDGFYKDGLIDRREYEFLKERWSK